MRFFGNVGSLVAAKAVPRVASLVALPIVSRFLDPLDFGVAAIAMSLIAFAGVLSDGGLGQSLIVKGAEDHRVSSTVFWLLVLLTGVLAVILAAVGFIAARLYGHDELTGMIAALAAIPMLMGIAAVPQVFIRRSGRYGALAGVNIVASIASTLALLGLAIAGAGPWALVGQAIVLNAVVTVCSLWIGGFVPTLVFDRSALGDHLSFGWNTTLVSVVRAAGQQLAPLLIGGFLGPATLGLFAMSTRLVGLPQVMLAAPIGEATFTAMARRNPDDAEIGHLFLAIVRLMALTTFVPAFVVAAAGGSAFAIILSPEWTKIAPIFALMAPGALLQAALSINGPVFMVKRQTGPRLRMTVEMTVLGLAAMLGALPLGVLAVAAARSLSFILYIPRMAWFQKKIGGAGFGEILAAVGPAFVVATVAAALQVALTRGLGLQPLPELGLAAGLTILCLALLIAARFRTTIEDLATLRRQSWT